MKLFNISTSIILITFFLSSNLFAQGFINPIFLQQQQGNPKEKKVERVQYVGQWEVADSEGKNFLINLKEDGTAVSNWKNGEEGSWEFKNAKAYVEWKNGWKDIIHKDGDGFKKVAYAPGSGFKDAPDNASRAKKV